MNTFAVGDGRGNERIGKSIINGKELIGALQSFIK